MQEGTDFERRIESILVDAGYYVEWWTGWVFTEYLVEWFVIRSYAATRCKISKFKYNVLQMVNNYDDAFTHFFYLFSNIIVQFRKTVEMGE